MKYFILEEDLLRFAFAIQYGGDINIGLAKFCKALDEEYIPKEHHRMSGGTFFRIKPYKDGFIWLSETATPSMLAHECIHAMNYISDLLEMPLNDDTEEVFAYYMEWMIREISIRLGWHTRTIKNPKVSKRVKRK